MKIPIAIATAKQIRPVKNLTYICPFCSSEYHLYKDAQACIRHAKSVINQKQQLQIGDIVTCGTYRFSWFNGDKNWIHSEGPGLHNHPCFKFYYVITYMEFETDYVAVNSRLTVLRHSPEFLHKICYHVATLAMKPSSGYHIGKTYNSHMLPIKIENPPEQIITQSKQMIMQKAIQLL